jgi:hypothetical protein
VAGRFPVRFVQHVLSGLKWTGYVAQQLVRTRSTSVSTQPGYAIGDPRHLSNAVRNDAPAQKSIRITTRRRVGRLTSVNPAAAKTPSVPTPSSSRITFLVVMG